MNSKTKETAETVKIRTFQDLKTWQEGHKLVLAIYGCTEKFPQKEVFGLSSQLRRAAVSVTSNIAEGFGRKTMKDKAHFYYQSNGSLLEVKNQLLIARDLKYIDMDTYAEIINVANFAHALLQGLLKASAR